MVDIKKYINVNLYDLIEVACDANENEIRRAYRRKALSCHPDKNPDNPKAAELFQELSKALEILTDNLARAAYDKVLNAKKQAEVRNKLLDSKRQKLKADLERREKAANIGSGVNDIYQTAKSDEERLKEEIERLRREGCKLLQEEQELMRNQLRQENNINSGFDSSKHRIKIKWKANKCDESNGGYTEEILRTYLKKYGDIEALVMSPKKKGSALIEFKTKEAGEMAVAYEKGNLTNPLSLQWVEGVIQHTKNHKTVTATTTERDYESLVLRQMRQAEERKRLIKQMMEEDKES